MVWRWSLALGVILCMRISSAQAQLSPGDLHITHAYLEGLENCGQCHNADDRRVSGKCLECHTMMRDQLDRKTGLHGQQNYVQCELCHVEHHGRDFDLIYWKGGRDVFDHGLTGYLLDGAHVKVRCRSCHTAVNVHDQERLRAAKKDLSRTFLGLRPQCADCHFDEHRGQFTGPCETCHTTAAWQPAVGFAHDTTDFPLTGKHKSTECKKCHETIVEGMLMADWEYIRYANVEHGACTDCHEDVHKNKLGQGCTDCHTTESWKLPQGQSFDHKKTRYPLLGMHASVDCDKCHKPGQPHTGVRHERCLDCHRDYHYAAFAERPQAGACEDCHTVSGFSPAVFSQQQHDSTDYPLRGAHRAIACFQCHQRTENDRSLRRAQFVYASTRCRDCHENPHGQRLAKLMPDDGCELCHRVEAWGESNYDHSKTEFPLEGRHRTATCRSCHRDTPSSASPDSLRFFELETACVDCHRDIHRGQFARPAAGGSEAVVPTDCKRCHTADDWRSTTFNHNRDSKYALEGAHKTVRCDGCHKTVGDGDERHVVYRPLDTTCKSCHGSKYTQEGARP